MANQLGSLVAVVVVIVGCLIGTVTQTTVAAAPPTPVFVDNFFVKGYLSLPYAELNEPFDAWFDKKSTRSRTDYFGDLYKIYQFGPRGVPLDSSSGVAKQYGALYKMVYVPAGFHAPNVTAPAAAATSSVRENFIKRIGAAFGGRAAAHFSARPATPSSASKEAPDSGASQRTPTKRVCFGAEGSAGNTIGPQSVLPDLGSFKYDSTGKCPHSNAEFSRDLQRRNHCELWKLVTVVGEKQNTYKFWVHRNEQTGVVTPVYYYMLGYDTLLGSHYDRYDIIYYNFKPDGASDADFVLEHRPNSCGPMPGPGQGSTTDAERRSQIVGANPIHEFVSEPHRYDHIDHEFDKFSRDHSKQHPSPEAKRNRWANFLHNLRFINSKNRQSKHYKLKVNKYADFSPNELRYLRGRRYTPGYNGGLDYESAHRLRGSQGLATSQLPETFDWNLRGAVTPVKDQATCGSCWSFGTSGTIEGAYFVKHGSLPRLSQQQMVDCSWQYGNNGCDGGEDFRAYQYIMNAGGLSTEEAYGHYMGVDGKCHDQDVEKAVKISGFYNVTSNSREALKHAVHTYGPVTVAIDASQRSFTFYSHGVYYDEKCQSSPNNLDHQVLVTGWTNIDGKFAWIVKNSWSTNWGNNGYILMSDENNNCGLMDSPTVPIIA